MSKFYITEFYLGTIVILKSFPFLIFFSSNLGISQFSSQHMKSTISVENVLFPKGALPHALICGVYSPSIVTPLSLEFLCLSRPALNAAFLKALPSLPLILN